MGYGKSCSRPRALGWKQRKEQERRARAPRSSRIGRFAEPQGATVATHECRLSALRDVDWVAGRNVNKALELVRQGERKQVEWTAEPLVWIPEGGCGRVVIFRDEKRLSPTLSRYDRVGLADHRMEMVHGHRKE